MKRRLKKREGRKCEVEKVQSALGCKFSDYAGLSGVACAVCVGIATQRTDVVALVMLFLCAAAAKTWSHDAFVSKHCQNKRKQTGCCSNANEGRRCGTEKKKVASRSTNMLREAKSTEHLRKTKEWCSEETTVTKV